MQRTSLRINRGAFCTRKFEEGECCFHMICCKCVVKCKDNCNPCNPCDPESTNNNTFVDPCGNCKIVSFDPCKRCCDQKNKCCNGHKTGCNFDNACSTKGCSTNACSTNACSTKGCSTKGSCTKGCSNKVESKKINCYCESKEKVNFKFIKEDDENENGECNCLECQEEADKQNRSKKRLSDSCDSQEDILETCESGNEFYVTVGNKEGHPWEHLITDTDECFLINGVKGKTIYLERGKKYKFTYAPKKNSGSHMLYFTGSSMGNKLNDEHMVCGTPEPFSHCRTINLEVTDEFPNLMYYQCACHKYHGGMIIIKEQ